MFIDDLQIYIQCKSSQIYIVLNFIQQHIFLIQNLTLENSLKLNHDKTQAIIFASSYHLKRFPMNDIGLLTIFDKSINFS